MKARRGDESGSRSARGTLYVVSTPIGNLEDITFRALRVLGSVALIAAENVSHTRRLCRTYKIKTRLLSYNQHNRKARGPEVIRRLKGGSDIALVTDAGTPGISDPGVYLINRAAAEGIRVTPVPGPSAVIAALSVAGMATNQFLFCGFLSSKPGRRKNELDRLTDDPRTMVFFEAPHRIRGMLEDLKAVLGDRGTVVVREMTKVFEEVKRGTVSEVLEGLDAERTRGEFTVVVEGSGAKGSGEVSREIRERVEKLLLEERMSVKDIASLVSRETDVGYRRIYRICLERKRALQGGR